MKNKFNLKRFFIALVILIPAILLLDVAYDAVFKTVVWNEIFAADNLFFKIAAALVGAYFYTTINNNNTKK